MDRHIQVPAALLPAIINHLGNLSVGQFAEMRRRKLEGQPNHE